MTYKNLLLMLTFSAMMTNIMAEKTFAGSTYYAATNNEDVVCSLTTLTKEETAELFSRPFFILADKGEVKVAGEVVEAYPPAKWFKKFRAVKVKITLADTADKNLYIPKKDYLSVKGIKKAFMDKEDKIGKFCSFKAKAFQYARASLGVILGSVCGIVGYVTQDLTGPAVWGLYLAAAGLAGIGGYDIFHNYKFSSRLQKLMNAQELDQVDESSDVYESKTSYMLTPGQSFTDIIFLNTKHVSANMFEEIIPELVYSNEPR